MSKKIIYEDDPFGTVKLGKKVKLFGLPIQLPSPEDLANAEKTTKITLSVSTKSLAYFKKVAMEHNVSYQAMIRRLLDEVSH